MRFVRFDFVKTCHAKCDGHQFDQDAKTRFADNVCGRKRSGKLSQTPKLGEKDHFNKAFLQFYAQYCPAFPEIAFTL